MRTPVVVHLTPASDHCPGFIKSKEQFAGEALVTQAAVEALHESILPASRELDVRSSDFDESEKLAQRLADELGAIVTANERKGHREW
ncbi:hypothetical protein Poly59_06880 [Rubripirellula reticaptiva]|uniref:Uncharacterized protein n=1 Tax=Rubripirellula reticaptiva TaxID=2528013 RepID=A0A5C6FDS1_9BACT|nr:hypothetical protein Poly59_06880 [Rubripirellula reticaptiva]